MVARWDGSVGLCTLSCRGHAKAIGSSSDLIASSQGDMKKACYRFDSRLFKNREGLLVVGPE